MSSGEKYVAGAYAVVFVTVLVYVVIIAAKLSRLERETAEAIAGASRALASSSWDVPWRVAGPWTGGRLRAPARSPIRAEK